MKKLMTILLCHAITVCAMAQSYAMSEAQSLTTQIEKWVDNGGSGGRTNISRCCKKGIRIGDGLSIRLAERNEDVPLPTYQLDDFLNNLQNEMDKNPHNFDIKYTDFKKAPKDKLPNDTKGYDFYVCTVTTSGSFAYTCKDLFLVKKDKVHGIAPYKEGKDNKVYIDWDDFIDEDETIGFTYNYGKHFPIGASAFYSFPEIPIMISLDFGLATGADEYIIDKVEMTDIMNYKRTKKTLDPKFFLTVTPHVYFRYFAIGCGAGFLQMSGTEEIASYSHTSSSSSGRNASVSTSSSSGSSSSTNAEKYNFMIRPTIKGFIPFNKEWALALTVNYDYVFGYKEKNGLSFGLGIKYTNW